MGGMEPGQNGVAGAKNPARSGEPLEFARDLFRGDRTRVVVWTSELP